MDNKMQNWRDTRCMVSMASQGPWPLHSMLPLQGEFMSFVMPNLRLEFVKSLEVFSTKCFSDCAVNERLCSIALFSFSTSVKSSVRPDSLYEPSGLRWTGSACSPRCAGWPCLKVQLVHLLDCCWIMPYNLRPGKSILFNCLGAKFDG